MASEIVKAPSYVEIPPALEDEPGDNEDTKNKKDKMRAQVFQMQTDIAANLVSAYHKGFESIKVN